MVYFSTVHSIISYGIIFWGVSTHSKIIFKIQKRIIRIITNSGNKDSCRNVFTKLNILPLQSQYIFSLLMFVVKNKDIFKTNLHLPPARLKIFQQGTFYSGIRAYNHLPKNIKDLLYDVKHFKKVLKAFFLTHAFYSLDEYFNSKFDVKVNSQL